MHEFRTLNLIGYRSKSIPNTFLKQEKDTGKLAIIYPGRGYTCEMPLLYYTSQVLLARGYDVLRVQYDYSANSEMGLLPKQGQHDWIGIDANSAYSLAMSQRKYSKLVLVGKSFGTIAMKAVVSTNKMPKSLKLIWFTPLLNDSELLGFITKSCRKNSLFIAGSRDEYSNKAQLQQVESAGAGRYMLIKDANHSMELEGKTVAQNIGVLNSIMAEVSRFVR